MASFNHNRRVARHDDSDAATTAAAAEWPGLAGEMPDEAEAASPGGVAAQLAGGVLPPGSGDPLYYRWDGASFYCRLCWKHVDEGHLRGICHPRRMANAARILFYDPEVGHMFRARAGNPQLTWPRSMMAELPAEASLLAGTTPWGPGWVAHSSNF